MSERLAECVMRAQIYGFLSQAFLYPQENWLEDLTDVKRILLNLDIPVRWEFDEESEKMDLNTLQAEHRHAFGLVGSLLYETEFGLPHEYRQSQEMADIAGFYHAFGFQMGGVKRERPDHLAVELEFMYALALKEAYTRFNNLTDSIEVVVDAQGKFLQDHLGKWTGLFSQVLAQGMRAQGLQAQSVRERVPDSQQESPYLALSLLAGDFVAADANRLGVPVKSQSDDELKPTPYDVDYSCSGCAVAETSPS